MEHRDGSPEPPSRGVRTLRRVDDPSAGSDPDLPPPPTSRPPLWLGPDAPTRCPVRVALDARPPAGVDPQEASAVACLRRGAARAWTTEVGERLVTSHPGAVVVDAALPRDARQDATLAALCAAAPLILGPELTPDTECGLRGSPDALVADPGATGRWWPLLIARHRTVGRGADELAGDPASAVVTLDQLVWRSEPVATGLLVRDDDAVRLAHHHRLLAAAGHASDNALGAVIGTEGVVVWQGLDEPLLRPPARRPTGPPISALARHRQECELRREALEPGASAARPVLIGECGRCPWEAHCRPQIEETDCVSLVPGINAPQWRALVAAGVADRATLARLDRRSVAVLQRLGDAAPTLLAEAAAVPAATPLSAVVATRPEPAEPPDLIDRAAELGLRTAGDLLALDPRVRALAEAPLRDLGAAVDQAWVATVGGGRPHLRRGVDHLTVPTADIEVDIDMENSLEGPAYLWGAWHEGRYVAHVSWAPAGPDQEAEVFSSFWAWVGELRRRAAAEGRSVAFHCWHQSAEAGALRAGAATTARLTGRPDLVEEVEGFLESGQIVDLLEVFRTQLIHGAGDGLKVVAPKAGFAWRDAAPSGDDSMAWHLEATTHPALEVREAAQARLLAYNEDDVRATAHVRAWMRALPERRLPD